MSSPSTLASSQYTAGVVPSVQLPALARPSSSVTESAPAIAAAGSVVKETAIPGTGEPSAAVTRTSGATATSDPTKAL